MNGKCDKCEQDTEVYFVGKGEDQELVCNNCLFKCPKCGKQSTGYPALSRRDNKTNICSPCGIVEALEDYRGTID